MAEAELDIIIRARDQASRALRNIQGATGRLGGALKRLAKVAIIGAAVGLVALGAAALKFGSDFQSAFATIRIGTGATGEALDTLKEDFKNALGQVPESMDKVATATADLNTRLGLTGKPLTDMTVKMLDLARITESDVGETIAASTRVFGDWSIATEDQAAALDHMFKVAQNTGIGVNALQQQVVQFGAPLRQMGFNFEDATVLMGKWEKEGVNAEAILGALKIGVANFAREGIDASTGLQNFIAEIQEMGPGFDATTRAIEVFGSRAGPDMVAAVLEGRFAIEDLSKAVADSGETIQGAAKDARTWQENLAILKNKVLVKLEPVLTKMIDKLTEFTDWLSRKGIPMAEDFGEVLQREFGPAVAFLRDAFDRLKPKAEAVGRVMISFLQFLNNNREILAALAIAITIALVPAFVAWAVAAGAAAIATIAATLPILLIIAAIALLVLGIILLVKHWDEVTAFIVDKALWLRDMVVGALQAFGDFIKSNWPKILLAILAPWLALILVMIGNWDRIWATIKAVASAAWGVIVGLFNRGKDALISALGSALGWIRDHWKEALLVALTGPFGVALLLFIRFKDDIVGVLKTLASQALAFGQQIPGMIWEGMKLLKGWLLGKAKSFVGELIDVLNPANWSFGSTMAEMYEKQGRMAGQAMMQALGSALTVPLPRLTAVVQPSRVLSSVFAGGGVGGTAVNHASVSAAGADLHIHIGPVHLSGSTTDEGIVELVDKIEDEVRSRRRRGF